MEATSPYGEASAPALVDAGWVVALVDPALLASFCAQIQPELSIRDHVA